MKTFQEYYIELNLPKVSPKDLEDKSFTLTKDRDLDEKGNTFYHHKGITMQRFDFYHEKKVCAVSFADLEIGDGIKEITFKADGSYVNIMDWENPTEFFKKVAVIIKHSGFKKLAFSPSKTIKDDSKPTSDLFRQLHYLKTKGNIKDETRYKELQKLLKTKKIPFDKTMSYLELMHYALEEAAILSVKDSSRTKLYARILKRFGITLKEYVFNSENLNAYAVFEVQ